eukprot:CCRYP_008381-RA/>CCRYP_008381-RA protein AED:0.11 eAED:0.11 QI:26/1/1/1/0.33/0.25/4/1513/367
MIASSSPPPATSPRQQSWIAALSALYVAIRVSTANLSPITDCDEVFNYWEPLHFVLYGTGMQTWEYAPQYALRTYAYLLPMAGVAKSYQFLLDRLPVVVVECLPRLLFLTQGSMLSSSSSFVLPSENKPLLFAMLRSTLAFFSSYAELSLLHSVHDILSPHLAYWMAFLQLTAAGNFHACSAYLPSSTVMILWQCSAANQFRGRDGWAIFWGLWAVLAVGWPFCAVLFVSTGGWALWRAYCNGDGDSEECGGSMSNVAGRGAGQTSRRAVGKVLIRTVFHAIVIQGIVMAIDDYFYGRTVSPIWNIFSYNARAGGDELYGVEPLSYYVKNLALNFNVVTLLGLSSLPILSLRVLVRTSTTSDESTRK